MNMYLSRDLSYCKIQNSDNILAGNLRSSLDYQVMIIDCYSD